MKFLVFALIVSTAAAASVGFKPVFNTANAYAEVNIPARRVVAAPVAQTSYPKSGVVGHDVEATVLRSDSEVNPDGYNYVYETSNGIQASASGSLKNVDKVDVLTVQGQYQYQSPEGPIEVTYVADENGYQPKGAHLPVPPPVPQAIARALQYIAAHPYKEEVVKKY